MSFAGFALIDYFAVFIRTAACIMLLPGFSMNQIPMRFRLYIAIGVSFSIFLLVENTFTLNQNPSAAEIFALVFTEMTIAVALVLSVRFLFLALSFLGEVLMVFLSFNPIPGTPIGDDQATTTLSSLFNITAIVLFFSSGLVMEVFGAIVQSFIVFPPGTIISGGDIVQNLTHKLGEFFYIVIRLGGPLIIFGIIMNLIAGLVNKLTPQIPIYFVATPFIICGGLVILTWIGDDMLLLFNREVQNHLNELF